jgi:hypothetical protein
MANILLRDDKVDEALNIIQKFEKFDEYYFLRTKCKLKIYELKGEPKKMLD